MQQQINTSPLSRNNNPSQRMNTHEAQTLYPSLRGQCHGRPVCTFTAKDIRHNPFNRITRS